MKEVTNVIARSPLLWKLYADFVKMTEYFSFKINLEEENKQR